MQDSSPTRTLTTPSDTEETLTAPDLVRAEPLLGRFRPTFALVDLGRLAHNFRALAARVGHDVAQIPVVKADGYGHGGVVVARRLAAEGASAFGVALVEEGVELRRAGRQQRRDSFPPARLEGRGPPRPRPLRPPPQ